MCASSSGQKICVCGCKYNDLLFVEGLIKLIYIKKSFLFFIKVVREVSLLLSSDYDTDVVCGSPCYGKKKEPSLLSALSKRKPPRSCQGKSLTAKPMGLRGTHTHNHTQLDMMKASPEGEGLACYIF